MSSLKSRLEALEAETIADDDREIAFFAAVRGPGISGECYRYSHASDEVLERCWLSRWPMNYGAEKLDKVLAAGVEVIIVCDRNQFDVPFTKIDERGALVGHVPRIGTADQWRQWRHYTPGEFSKEIEKGRR